jgi:hypothetical protein
MMDALLAFHFLHPWALIAIAPAVLLWVAERSAADTTARWLRVIDPVLLRN